LFAHILTSQECENVPSAWRPLWTEDWREDTMIYHSILRATFEYF